MNYYKEHLAKTYAADPERYCVNLGCVDHCSFAGTGCRNLTGDGLEFCPHLELVKGTQMEQKPDMLVSLFAMQAKLNNATFEKRGILGRDSRPMTMETLHAMGSQENVNLGPNTLTNEWLRKYLEALNDESRELGDELLWKWWSKDHLNLQNIRVEIIDQLHFWISLAITAGMDAQKVYDIYCQKNAVNFQRQEQGYSKATKNEQDNEGIV